MIHHIKKCQYKSHTEAAKRIQDSSHDTITPEDGQILQKHIFSESFLHVMDLVDLRAAGLSQAFMDKEELREYVRGYDARASFLNTITASRPHRHLFLSTAVRCLQTRHLVCSFLASSAEEGEDSSASDCTFPGMPHIPRAFPRFLHSHDRVMSRLSRLRAIRRDRRDSTGCVCPYSPFTGHNLKFRAVSLWISLPMNEENSCFGP